VNNNAATIRYRRNRELMEANFGDELVALDRKIGVCLSFNEAATHIWRSLETPTMVSDIIEGLLQEFDVDAHECRRDVLELIAELEAMGLVARIEND
jgi:hypothetical protein